MGFEDEVEQSLRRPCRQTDGRSKQTYDLTSSIVPRGTSFHRSVELEYAAQNLAEAGCSVSEIMAITGHPLGRDGDALLPSGPRKSAWRGVQSQSWKRLIAPS